MTVPKLTDNGEVVESFSATKPTNLEYLETRDTPTLVQNVLPLRPLGDHIPSNGTRYPVAVPTDRALRADGDLVNLFADPRVTRIDLTPSIGTQITNLQLATLTDKQKDELALLVAHRGVEFFRDQDITPPGTERSF